MVRFRACLLWAAFGATLVSSSAGADDIGAAARGVVRVIVVAEDYANTENSSVTFGSGFAISPHHIVTNAHVVEAAENPYADSAVAIVPSEGSRALRGTVVAYDSARDMAIIDVGSARLEPLAVYSGPVDAGAHTAALGYPGNVDAATITSLNDLVTPTAPVRAEGNISSQRNVDGTPAFLHTAPISRGNSGGPLVDDCGRVLGVNTYTAVAEAGDAPFGFAIVSQQLMSFLREHGEAFQQVGSACVTMAEQTQRDAQARDAADRARAASDQLAAAEQQRALDAAKAAAEDSRENHVASSALLTVLALIAGALAAALFLKDRNRGAIASATLAAIGLGGSGYAFLSRPSLNVSVPTPAPKPSAAVKPLSGKLLCQVDPNLSRVTISSTDDLAMDWDNSGCMNGRTQYVQEGPAWRRVLVPNGSETVYVQDFDPAKREYVSTRYLLPQSDMDRLRQIRLGSTGKTCSTDPATIEELERVTENLASSLPPVPNEKLVYQCSSGTSRN